MSEISCPSTKLYFWFQTFAMFCMLYIFFWVIPRRLNFICRRFGTLCLFHLHRQVGVEWLNLRIVGVSTREKVWLENSLRQPFSRWLPKLFSNLVIHHLPAYEDETDRVFRNVGMHNSDAGESPRRKHTTYRTRRKFEIKNFVFIYISLSVGCLVACR